MEGCVETMKIADQEWLVTDRRGAFAMGTLEGIRTRKYHGFFMGIPGRSETSFLTDLDFSCNGISLWPHRYISPEGPLTFPELPENVHLKDASLTPKGPQWRWLMPGGVLSFSVSACDPGGLALAWEWSSRSKKTCNLIVRDFWAMRDLHGLGGKVWTRNSDASIPNRFQVVSSDGKVVHGLLKGEWLWTEDPQWNENFHYSEEIFRGYPGEERLYSAGVFEITLRSGEGGEWIFAEDPNDMNERDKKPRKTKSKVLDFVLTRPAGVVAGFPWFGEWGRDTFISVPGVVAVWLKEEKDSEKVWLWAQELIHRWGEWIERRGMLPNVIEQGGICQWESADATLWWCHSLASLWVYSLCPPYPFADIQFEFRNLLMKAIESIRSGGHRFLKELPNGLLEVTEPHASWMDARINGEAVTPRLGTLPEINALWFEACCLQWLWTEEPLKGIDLEDLGTKVLQCREPDRPNTVFLHSLPLAPSFVLGKSDQLERDLHEIGKHFWTPVGLRTLRPEHPSFKPHCVGTQVQRDSCYHQGAAWGWLAGQFEAACDRLSVDHSLRCEKVFTGEILKDMPIQGHIPEIFDADPPYTPRGTPAQAWSLACWEEVKARKRMRADLKVSKVLARRWLSRKERKIAV